jgi:hypothetical protein|tara:strand:- start:2624 stop:3043 length:420 start_codon:yes stop_codon:yes gene_type:complete
MISKKHLKDLENLIDEGMRNIDMPHVSNGNIRIQNYLIRENLQNTFSIIDLRAQQKVHTTYFKYSAIALVKALCKKQTVEKILKLDEQLLKHSNDAMFYKYSMKKTKDYEYLEIREVRLDIAENETRQIKNKLNTYIYS